MFADKKCKVQGHHTKVKGQRWKNCISLYFVIHSECINTSTNQIRQNLQMTLTYIFNFWSQLQGQRSNIKTDLLVHIYGIRQCYMPKIKLLLFIVPEILSREIICSEGHWVKAKSQICKISSICTTTRHDVSRTKCEPSLINVCWVMAQTRSDKKCKVQGHHAKVKGQWWKICILLYLVVHSEFINTSTNQIQQNLQMTLTYIFNFWSQLQGLRSNIKTDLPVHTYGIRQCYMLKIKLLLFIVPEILSRQKFCSEGHWVKVKGWIQKRNTLYGQLHATCWISTFFDLHLLSNASDIPDI